MSKKIPSANIKITSALRSILNGTGLVTSSSLVTQKLGAALNTISLNKSARLNTQSPIDHIVLEEVGAVIRSQRLDDSTLGIFDVSAFTLNKVFADILLSPTDAIQTFGIIKGVSDTAIPTDVLSRIVNYNVPLIDTSIPADRPYKGFDKAPINDFTGIPSAEISTKDFIKGLSDFTEVPIDAIQSFTFNKALSDAPVILDLLDADDGITHTFSKGQVDYTDPVVDSLSTLIGYIREYFDIVDSPTDFITNKDFTKSNTDTAIASELFSRVVDFNVPLADIEYPLDFISAIDFNKILSDSVITIDNANIEDGSTFDLNRVLNTSSEIPIDELSRVVDYNRQFFDNEIPTDDETIQFIKSLADSVITIDNANIEDGSTFDLNRVLADFTVGFSETTIFDFIKSLNDIPITEDRPYKTFNKGTISDETDVPIDDAAIDFIKSLQEFVATIEATNIFDGSLYQFIKGISDFPIATESFSRVVDFNTQYFDASIPDDRPYKEFVKAPINDFTRYWFTEGPSTHLTDEYAVDYFETVISPDGWQDEYVIAIGPIIDFIKALSDSVTTIDNANIDDGSTFDLNRIIPPITAIATDFSVNHPQLGKSDSVSGNDNGTPVDEEYYAINYWPDTYIDDFLDGVIKDFNKHLFDFPIPLDLLSVFLETTLPSDSFTTADDSIFATIKVLADTPDILDDQAKSVEKPLFDTLQPHTGPGYGDSNDYATSYVKELYTVRFRPIWTLYKPFYEDQPTSQFYTAQITKPFTETLFTSGDTVLLYTELAKADSVTPTEDISTFDIILNKADAVEAVDLAGIFDGSLYSINLSKNESLIASDYYISFLLKPLSDSVIILDDGDISTFALEKPLTETKRPVEGPAYGDEEGYVISYFADNYTEFAQPIWSLIKPLYETPVILNVPYITIIKGPSSFTDSKEATDFYISTLFKPFTESPFGTDNGIAVDEEYYAINYWPETYIDDFLSSVTRVFNKVLGDIVTVLDSAAAEITGFKIPGVEASPFDVTNYSIIKALTETPDILDDQSIATQKVLSEILQPHTGPGYGDSNDYATSYVGALYTVRFRPIWTLTKPFSDIVSPPDHNEYTLIKPLSETLSTSGDTVLLYPELAKADSVIPLEDITTFDISLVKADAVEAVDLAGIFDGSLYSINLSKNESITSSDFYTSQFTKAFNDPVTILDDGNLFTYELYKPLTEAQRGLEGPAYNDEEGYVISYFADNYAEFAGPIYTLLKPLSDIASPPDHYEYALTKPFADSVSSISDSLSSIDTILGFSDSVTTEETTNIIDGSLYAYVKEVNETIISTEEILILVSAGKSYFDIVPPHVDTGVVVIQNYMDTNEYYGQDYMGVGRIFTSENQFEGDLLLQTNYFPVTTDDLTRQEGSQDLNA